MRRVPALVGTRSLFLKTGKCSFNYLFSDLSAYTTFISTILHLTLHSLNLTQQPKKLLTLNSQFSHNSVY